MSSTIPVDLGDRSYSIEVGADLLARLGPLCKKLGLYSSCLVVSDGHVDTHYGAACARSLETAGFTPARVVVPPGEPSKSQTQLFYIYDQALEAGLDRNAFIVALGGGGVGDLAGYAAASYLRGIPYIQVPTTLLAMVDSSVGGKTSINLPQGKNLIGAFHQPVGVLADTTTLKTLPEREYKAGLAEVIKYGIIQNAALFETLEKELDDLLDMDLETLEPVITRCCEIKAAIVHQDEREAGLRSILNFGHTVGHAIEQVSGYRQYLHGEAIAIGMNYAAHLSVKERGLTQKECDRICRLIQASGLPMKAPDHEWPAMRNAMQADKKNVAHTPRFVLAKGIGSVAHGCEVPEQLLEDVWYDCCQ